MGDIINLNKEKIRLDENKKNNKNYVLLIEKLFEYSKIFKGGFKSNFKKNIEILESNYMNINKKALSGNIEYSEFEKFIKLLTGLLDFNDADFKYYFILFFYKLYQNYGNKIFELDNELLEQLIRTYSLFYEEDNINVLDDALEFLFDEEIRNEMMDLFPDYKELGNHIISIADEIIEDDKKSWKVIVRQYLDNYKKDSVKYKDVDDFDIGIITPEIIKEKMSSQLAGFVGMYYVKYEETKDEHFLNLAHELENNLDTMVIKLKNVKKEEQIKVFDTIRKIWTNSETPLIQKADMIFNVVNVMSKENIKTSIK